MKLGNTILWKSIERGCLEHSDKVIPQLLLRKSYFLEPLLKKKSIMLRGRRELEISLSECSKHLRPIVFQSIAFPIFAPRDPVGNVAPTCKCKLNIGNM